MLDLNRLKHINDTMGHKARNRMIFNFPDILCNTIPPSNIICHWGGDEFTVIIPDADRNKMESCVSAISAAVNAYNETGEKPAISFASGYALSSELPELSRKGAP